MPLCLTTKYKKDLTTYTNVIRSYILLIIYFEQSLSSNCRARIIVLSILLYWYDPILPQKTISRLFAVAKDLYCLYKARLSSVNIG